MKIKEAIKLIEENGKWQHGILNDFYTAESLTGDPLIDGWAYSTLTYMNVSITHVSEFTYPTNEPDNITILNPPKNKPNCDIVHCPPEAHIKYDTYIPLQLQDELIAEFNGTNWDRKWKRKFIAFEKWKGKLPITRAELYPRDLLLPHTCELSTVQRTENVPLTFIGHVIGEGYTEDNNCGGYPSGTPGVWQEVKVYKEKHGSFIVAIATLTCWEGSSDSYTVKIHQTLGEAISSIPSDELKKCLLDNSPEVKQQLQHKNAYAN